MIVEEIRALNPIFTGVMVFVSEGFPVTCLEGTPGNGGILIDLLILNLVTRSALYPRHTAPYAF